MKKNRIIITCLLVAGTALFIGSRVTELLSDNPETPALAEHSSSENVTTPTIQEEALHEITVADDENFFIRLRIPEAFLEAARENNVYALTNQFNFPKNAAGVPQWGMGETLPQDSHWEVSHSEVEWEMFENIDLDWDSGFKDVAEAHHALFRDEVLGHIAIHPIQYDKSTRTLRVAKNLDLGVSLKPSLSITPQLSGLASSGFPALSESDGDCVCSERVVLAEDFLPEMNGNPTDFDMRRAGAEVDACIKIRIDQTGLHRVTRAALVNAGVDASDIIGADLRLFNGEDEVAIWCSTTGPFSSSDYFVFYGRELKGFHTDENVYWLGMGPNGARIAERPANYNINRTLATEYCQTVTRAQKNSWRFTDSYSSDDPNYDGWFETFISGVATLNFTVPFRNEAVYPGTVNMSLSYKPFTETVHHNPDHNVRLTSGRNGDALINFSTDGVDYFTGSGSFSTWHFDPGNATEPQHTLITTESGFHGGQNYGDFVFVDSFQMTFPREHWAINNQLGFNGNTGDFNYRIKGITGNNTPWIMDVSNPVQPVLLTGSYYFLAGSYYELRFGEDLGYSPCYHIAGNDALFNVSSSDISLETFRDLSSLRNQADYIMILPEFLQSASLDLLKQRAEQGIRVLTAFPDEIYNEFGYGITDVRAIKQFLGFAYHYYQGEKPKYVLLAGDGTYDPGLEKEFEADVIPVPLARKRQVYAPVDHWYATVNGSDNMPDMVVGRMNVKSVADFNIMKSNTINYEDVTGSPSWKTAITLIADNESPANPSPFEQSCETIRNTILPGSWTKETGYLDVSGGNKAAVRSTLLNAFDAGRRFIHYEGHGAFDRLALETLFENADVATLNNSILPIYNVMTCNNGRYHYPANPCTIEELLTHGIGKGAVAAIAPTTEAIGSISSTLGQQFYEAIVNNKHVVSFTPPDTFTHTTVPTDRLGDALLNGLKAVYLKNLGVAELEIYLIFGDPALQVN